MLVYKIPYRRAPRLACRLSTPREHSYLACNFYACKQDTLMSRARKGILNAIFMHDGAYFVSYIPIYALIAYVRLASKLKRMRDNTNRVACIHDTIKL